MISGLIIAVVILVAYSIIKYEINTHRNTNAENVEYVAPELKSYRSKYPL